MTAVSGTFVTAGDSAVFTPSQSVSEIRVSGGGHNQVAVWSKTTSGDWEELVRGRGSLVLQTPDNSITYKFVAVGTTIDIDYYIGP